MEGSSNHQSSFSSNRIKFVLISSRGGEIIQETVCFLLDAAFCILQLVLFVQQLGMGPYFPNQGVDVSFQFLYLQMMGKTMAVKYASLTLTPSRETINAEG